MKGAKEMKVGRRGGGKYIGKERREGEEGSKEERRGRGDT